MQNIRSEMVAELIELGIPVEAHHHEVATGGQCEIDMRYQDLVTMADNVMMYKYVCKNVAARHGKVVTFMPKPLFQDNGSGHARALQPVEGRQAAVRRQQVRGPERHGPVRDRRDPEARRGAVRAHATRRPTATSGSCPGYEAPVNLVYSSRNRSAAIRIPMYSENPKTKRIEFRCPDSSLQPVPRVQRHRRWPPSTASRTRSTPATRWTRTSTTSRPRSTRRSAPPPASLDEALDELENDHDFLLKGDVFTADVIHYWIKYKRENEVDAIRMRPHPYEFCMYFDI